MNLYVGQELTGYSGDSPIITVTQVVNHKNHATGKGIMNNFRESEYLIHLDTRFTLGYYYEPIKIDLEDYLPNLTFHKPPDERILTINLGLVYGDKYTLNRLTKDVLKDIIISKEKYMEHYGGVLKLLDLYETYEKRIDHIIKTLVLLLHFDLTDKEKICN